MEKNNHKYIHLNFLMKKWISPIKKYSAVLLLCGVLACVCTTSVAFAHVTGSSWEQVYGDYKVDVGYDPADFIVGQPQRLDFNVVKEQSLEDVPFEDVWVRISQGSKTIFASGLHKPSLGKTGMTFTFPEAGGYELSARFEKESGTIVEATFPFTVQAPVQPKAKPNILRLIVLWGGWALAVVSIGLASYAFRRKTKH